MRAGTKDAKKMTKSPEDQENYLSRLALIIKDYNIPPELVFFWDEYAQHLVPTSKSTFAKRGSKDVIIHGLADKRQVTGTLCHNGNLEFIGGQLIFQVLNLFFLPPSLSTYANFLKGTTNACHPRTTQPDNWIYCHSDNHWQQKETMKEFAEKVLFKARLEAIENLNLAEDQMAVR